MSQTAIRAEGISKQYRIGSLTRYWSLRESLSTAARRVVEMGRRLPAEFIWALQDVSFEVREGETLGIIGRNGAGKTTLLKILSRITPPSSGEVIVRGRVGSLLEVGTGFHPELTGRENIYLNGAILGMKKAEIHGKFDDIVAFAEIEAFLDTPVKRYSSGMYMRLAFSVAAHLDPEILIVDEVLAVGDAAFQKRCLGKMEEAAGGGRTILFVSHNMSAIQRLCDRVLWLDGGSVKLLSDASRVVSDYLLEGVSHEGAMRFDPPLALPGGMPVGIVRAELRDEDGMPRATFPASRPIVLRIEWENTSNLYKPRIGFLLMTSNGTEVMTSLDSSAWENPDLPPGRRISECTIPGGVLNEGEYFVELGADSPNRYPYLKNCTGPLLRFEVEDDLGLRGKYYGQEGVWDGRWQGVVALNLDWLQKDAGADHGGQRGSTE